MIFDGEQCGTFIIEQSLITGRHAGAEPQQVALPEVEPYRGVSACGLHRQFQFENHVSRKQFLLPTILRMMKSSGNGRPTPSSGLGKSSLNALEIFKSSLSNEFRNEDMSSYGMFLTKSQAAFLILIIVSRKTK